MKRLTPDEHLDECVRLGRTYTVRLEVDSFDGVYQGGMQGPFTREEADEIVATYVAVAKRQGWRVRAAPCEKCAEIGGADAV